MMQSETEGPGREPSGRLGILLTGAYLVAFSILSVTSLVQLWPLQQAEAGASLLSATPTRTTTPTQPAALTPSPSPRVTLQAATPSSTAVISGIAITVTPSATPATPSPSPTPATDPLPAHWLVWNFTLSNEKRLLLLVILAGAVGSLVHGLRSFYWYVGNRELKPSWVPMYLVLPFSGSAIALLFYFVIRGGFFSPQASFVQTSPFGFAALGALVGMFSQQAALKLQEIAETILTKPAPGQNAVPQPKVVPGQNAVPQPARPPRIGNITPLELLHQTEATLTVEGSDFASNAEVRANDVPLVTRFVSPTQLTATVKADLLAVPGTAKIVVLNPGAGSSDPKTLTVT
jgi:hypothetical protein